MSAPTTSAAPPAWAWDWFARQRLLWRTAQTRLAAASTPAQSRYAKLADRPDVLPALREDYPQDAVVRDVIHGVIEEYVFLGRTDGHFEDLGARNAPRGMRWWWTAITDKDAPAPVKAAPPAEQLALSEILTGFGD